MISDRGDMDSCEMEAKSSTDNDVLVNNENSNNTSFLGNNQSELNRMLIPDGRFDSGSFPKEDKMRSPKECSLEEVSQNILYLFELNFWLSWI